MKTEFESVASQYAEAILELASSSEQGSDTAAIVASDLGLICQIFNNAPELSLVLEHPGVSASDKKQLLLLLFQKKVNDLSLRLLELLIDKRRIALIPQVNHCYHNLLNSRQQIVTAKLVSSFQLDDKSVANIKARLTEHLGKKLALEVTVDSSLIGGFILRLGDQVIDGSLKGRLKNIEKLLLAV